MGVASHGDGGDGDGGGDDDDDDDDDDGGGSGGRNVPGSCSTWYEVGKYQVDNPFEKGCECTRVTYTHATKAFATSCVKNGKVENVTATLIPSPIGMYEGVEFLAEFDCVHHLLGDISYCYHVFVRNADGSHPQGLIEFAQSFAAKAGLNPQSTTWQVTSQANCIN